MRSWIAAQSSRRSAMCCATRLILLGALAPLAGLGAGVIGALFREALEQANHLREALASGLGA
jgi:hypothetical protein